MQENQRQQLQQQRQQQRKQQNSSTNNRSNSNANRLDVNENSNDNIRTAAGTTAAAATSTETTTTGTTASRSVRTAAAALTATKAAASIRTCARATKSVWRTAAAACWSRSASNRTTKGCRRTTDSSYTRRGGGFGSELAAACTTGVAKSALSVVLRPPERRWPRRRLRMRVHAPARDWVTVRPAGSGTGAARLQPSRAPAARVRRRHRRRRGGDCRGTGRLCVRRRHGRERPSRIPPRARRSRKSAAPVGVRGRPPRSAPHRWSRWPMQLPRRGTSCLCRLLPSMRHRGVRRLLCRCLQRRRRWGAP